MIQRNTQTAKPIVYPDSDGQPIADNTVQFDWIVLLKTGFDYEFSDEDLVFVAGDLLWYPVEGRPDIRVAPDVMIVFGRPKGDRGSYIQFREENIAPQVVFEILSPGNRAGKLAKKRALYAAYGVEEYYEFDPDKGKLTVWLRSASGLEKQPPSESWVSPRLGVRFEGSGENFQVIGRGGRPFKSPEETAQERDQAKQERDRETRARLKAQKTSRKSEKLRLEADQRAEQERQRAEQERQRAEQERQRRLEAERHARIVEEREREAERQRLLLAEQKQESDRTSRANSERAERLAAKLRALGIEPEE